MYFILFFELPLFFALLLSFAREILKRFRLLISLIFLFYAGLAVLLFAFFSAFLLFMRATPKKPNE